jgi:integrase
LFFILMATSPSPELVRDILLSLEAESVARYQDPKIEIKGAKGKEYYQIRPYVRRLTPDGLVPERKPLKLGPVSKDFTMSNAKAEKQRIMATINAGRFLVQSQVQFASILETYERAAIPGLGPETQKTYLRHIRLHIRPALSELRMCDIDRLAVRQWLNDKQSEGLSHNTLIDLRKVLSAIFSKAAEWGFWQGDNPCSKQKVGGPRKIHNKKPPTAEGLIRFLAEIRDSKIIDAAGARLIVVTGISLGNRPGETLGLKVEHINAAAQTVAIQRSWGRGEAKETKTPESERIRQAPGLASELLGYAGGKRADEYIFSCAGEPPDDRDLQQHVFRPAAERAGIYAKGFGLHVFRHLNLTWRTQVGASPIEAMQAAGHKRLSTTWDYLHTDEDREKLHVQAILARLNGLPAGQGSVQ